MKASGKLLDFKTLEQAAKKTAYAKRLQKEFKNLCDEFKITPSNAIRKLFIKARNNGYHAGFFTGQKRGLK